MIRHGNRSRSTIVLPALVVGTLRLALRPGPGPVARTGSGASAAASGPCRFNLWQMMTGSSWRPWCCIVFSGRCRADHVPHARLAASGPGLVRPELAQGIRLPHGPARRRLPGPARQADLGVVLLVFAPIGVWFFRSYRLAHWPEPKSGDRPRVRAASRRSPGRATQPA